MDTILLLLLLYGIYKKLTKGSKKQPSRRVATSLKQAAETIQRQAEEKKTQRQLHMDTAVSQPLGEGVSHMAFTQDAHGCISEREEYMGSLNADTSEGEDACDLSLGHERQENLDPQSVYADQIGMESPLDFSPRGLYQGIVMSEILTRPGKRTFRRF